MTTEQFVIVVREDTYCGDTSFRYAKTEKEAIDIITSYATTEISRDGNAYKVERVFKFDEYGSVTHYEMTVKGFKPALEAIPQNR